MTDHSFHFVAMLDEIPAGTNKCYKVADQNLLVCHTKTGEVHTVENLCSHALQTLEGGRMRGFKIICPLHGASFDMRTGAVTGAPAYEPIKAYETKVVDGKVFAKL